MQLDHLQLEANKIGPKMGIYLFRTGHLGAYNDIYRVLVTPVVGHLYVRAGKAFAVQLDGNTTPVRQRHLSESDICPNQGTRKKRHLSEIVT